MAVKQITKKVVEGLKQGETVRDKQVRGFCVRKQLRDPSYLLDATIDGRRRIITIGKHGSPYTPETARNAAIQILGEIKKGKDPAAAREAIKGIPTLAELCDQYTKAAPDLLLARRGRPKKESTLYTDKGRIEGHIKPLLGRLPVNVVTKKDIEGFLQNVASGKTAKKTKTKPHGVSHVRGGTGTATRTVGLLGAIFSYAQKLNYRADNPVHGVEKFRGQTHKKSLSRDEYKKIGDCLNLAKANEISATGLAVIRFLALTGWRLSEVTKLRWDAIDKEHNTAHLGDTKTDASKRPLSELAIDIIEQQLRINDWIFPNITGDSHFNNFGKVLKKIKKLSETTPSFTAKTFRSAFASLGNDMGYASATIGEIIGHRGERNVTAQFYIQPADEVIVAAANKIAEETERRLSGSTEVISPKNELSGTQKKVEAYKPRKNKNKKSKNTLSRANKWQDKVRGMNLMVEN